MAKEDNTKTLPASLLFLTGAKLFLSVQKKRGSEKNDLGI